MLWMFTLNKQKNIINPTRFAIARLVVIIMHIVCIVIQFTIAGIVSKKNPIVLIKNQIPGYTTALGTQSSAATIPVNLKCAEADGVCEQIRNFVVPLCANIHMAVR